MTDAPIGQAGELGVAPREAASITSAHVLCVSSSMKPAPGGSTPSACRNLLVHATRQVATIYPAIRILDLREDPLPWFDGRMPAEMPLDPVGNCHDMVVRAGALYLGIPAYWRAVGGSFKNFVEVLSGPAYDARAVETPFSGKLVGYFVVGADDESALAADRQARSILDSLGARVAGTPIVLGNPAESRESLPRVANRIVAELASLVQQVAKRVTSAR